MGRIKKEGSKQGKKLKRENTKKKEKEGANSHKLRKEISQEK